MFHNIFVNYGWLIEVAVVAVVVVAKTYRWCSR